LAFANVLPKLRKWHAEMDEQYSAVESIRLVSLEAYNNLYQELKKKYLFLTSHGVWSTTFRNIF
jgi:hypothetical protein